VGRDELYEQTGIPSVGFEEGTRVYVTLPGGKRTGFTFKPVMDPEIVKALRMGAPLPQSMIFYNPAFETDDGSQVTLSAQKTQLLYNQETGQYYHPSGSPYNPANSFFGGSYTLTTKEGIEYAIDGTTGDLLTVTDTNGNTLTYSDEGIFSSTGKSVTFERNAAGRIVAAIDPEGERIEYEYDENGDLVGVTDREENTTRFEYHEEREHYLEEIIDPLGRTGVRTEYDEKGRLKQMVDANGSAVELVYDPDNSVQKVKDVFGKETTYVYDSRGNVLTEIDPLGKRIDRTYDADNNLLTETDADGVTTKYTYDNRRNLLTIEDGRGNITRMTYDNQGRATSIVSPSGLKTTAKYDSRGNLIESIDTNGLKTTYTYNPQGQLLTQTAPDGQVTKFEYNTSGNIKRTIDSRGNVVDFDYNPNGQIEVATTTFTLNGQTHTLSMEYDYDNEGRIIATRTSQGNNQSIAYDALGRVKSVTDIFGNVTNHRYDLPLTPGENNPPGFRPITRINEITLPDNTPNNSSDNPKVINKYDAANNLIAQISPTGLETRYVYDDLNRLTETVMPDLTPTDWTDNPRSKIEYSDGGRIQSYTDILGNKTQYVYNDIGQLTQVIDAFNKATTYTYNKGGQIETVTDHRQRKTQYVYDDKARVKEVIFFDNSRFKLTYDELGRVKTETNELNQTTTYEYNDYGQIKAVINANNERTEFEYDSRRNLIRVTDALGQSTRFKYDEYGQRVETTFYNDDKVLMGYDRFGRVTRVTDENSHVTHYDYDNLSQLTGIEQLLPEQSLTAKTNYTYDNLGRLIGVEDANENLTQFEYDDWNRPTATVLPMGQRNRTDYNPFGQVIATTDFNGDTINYGYDSYGRLKNQTFTDSRIPAVSYDYDPVTLQLAAVTQEGRGATYYTYDNYDRLATLTTPDQKVVQYGYDLLNNITSLVTPAGTVSYGYDSLNRLDTVSEGTRILADYDYNPVGNLSKTTFANGSVESRQYDSRNRLKQVTTRNVVGTIFSDFKYTLDGVGNRTKVEEYGGRTVDYTYDALNRLTQEKMVGGVTGERTIDYTYDLAGNRLTRSDSVSGLVTNYSYDDNNRLQSLTEGNQPTTFTYDDNGSLLQRSNGTETVDYEWMNDGENRLVEVRNSEAGGTTQTQFVYDAFGNRVASIVDGARTNYLTASVGGLPQVLMEYDANNQITADYTHGLGLVAATRNNREGFYHTDGIGSTRVITDSVGLVTDRYTYDAFGTLLNQTGTFGNSFQFAGEQRDGSTGLDYLRARYYDPTLGRFISKDPFAGFLNDPMSQHDYQYAHANPVRFTDPTGYFTMGDIMATLSGVGALAAIGGVSFGAGYIGGAAAGGASGEEILGMFGDFGAGFASGVSGGYLTDVYEAYSGKEVEPTHGALWGAGTVTGIGVSFLLGMKLPQLAATAVGPLKWVATAGMAVDMGLDVYGAATATGNLYQSYQDNGQWEVQDSWNLLAYVPFVGMTLGVAKGIGAARKVKGGVPGADDVLATQSTRTAVAGGGPQCFVAGTEILTTEGIKNIEDIQVGDWVIADDPITPGGVVARQVLETFVRETDALYDLYVDGEVISTTGEHPFWVPDFGWVEAKDLTVGSLLQTADGKVVDVDKIERREGKFEVYNFKVEGIPTYFVSELGILVHNICNPPAGGGNDLLPLSPRAQQRMAEDPLFHNFPRGLEPDILNRPPSLIRPDGRQEFLARGSIGDRDGVYHITVTVDGQIDHRTFIPENDWDRFAGRWGLPALNQI
jgi:RHS repeat-associated protein